MCLTKRVLDSRLPAYSGKTLLPRARGTDLRSGGATRYVLYLAAR
jgi:hypothetical protein